MEQVQLHLQVPAEELCFANAGFSLVSEKDMELARRLRKMRRVSDLSWSAVFRELFPSIGDSLEEGEGLLNHLV